MGVSGGLRSERPCHRPCLDQGQDSPQSGRESSPEENIKDVFSNDSLSPGTKRSGMVNRLNISTMYNETVSGLSSRFCGSPVDVRYPFSDPTQTRP